MPRGKQLFKQGDVTRAVKAALKAGLDVELVKIDEAGTIAVSVKPPDQKSAEDSVNEWDEVR
jgi:hypothetical protein